MDKEKMAELQRKLMEAKSILRFLQGKFPSNSHDFKEITKTLIILDEDCNE